MISKVIVISNIRYNVALEDKVVDSPDDIGEQTIFSQGFDAITDIEVGPHSYMYILTHDTSKVSTRKIRRER